MHITNKYKCDCWNIIQPTPLETSMSSYWICWQCWDKIEIHSLVPSMYKIDGEWVLKAWEYTQL